MKLDQAKKEYERELEVAEAQVREILERHPNADNSATLYGLRGQAVRAARGHLKEVLVLDGSDPETYGTEIVRLCREAEQALIKGPLTDSGVERFSLVLEALAFLTAGVEIAKEKVDTARLEKTKGRAKS